MVKRLSWQKYEIVVGEKVIAYNHPGNRIATIVAFNKDINDQTAKDVAMQAAAMAPVALDKGDVDAETITREMEIAKETTRAEGKPGRMVEKNCNG